MYKYLLLTLSVLCIFATQSRADDPADFVKEIAQAESYLQNLTTGKARFIQTADDGSQIMGTFYISRPGKLRFEYDDPIKDFVVADGLFIYFYDSQLGEQMNMPLGQNMADFILRKDISLYEDVLISDVKRGGDLLQIKLVQKNDPDAGALLLGFQEDPMRLKKWRVVDAQGLITEVELFYFETGQELDEDALFVYRDPNKGKVPAYNE